MKYQSLDHIATQAEVTPVRPEMTRKERLTRLAKIVRPMGKAEIPQLRWVEFYAEPERQRLRRENSLLSIAFADPELRAAGLAGDTLGDIQRFFELSDDEAHRLVCDCHLFDAQTGKAVSKRVSRLAGNWLWWL